MTAIKIKLGQGCSSEFMQGQVWSSKLKGKVTRLCRKVGSQVWFLRLGLNVEYHGWLPWLGPMFGSHVWVPRLGPKVRSQGLGPKVGA